MTDDKIIQMDRFFELQDKVKSVRGGFRKLSKEEQKEYSALLKLGLGESKVPEVKESPAAKVIPLEQAEIEKNKETQIERLVKSLEEANQRISLLEYQKAASPLKEETREGWQEKKERPKNRIATLTTWRESIDHEFMILIGRQFCRRVFDQNKNQNFDIYRFTFLAKDGQTFVKELPLLDIVRSKTFVTVSLEKEYKKEMRRLVGQTVDRRRYDYENFKDHPERQTDLYEERVDREFDVMLPDGRMLRVPEFILNGS